VTSKKKVIAISSLWLLVLNRAYFYLISEIMGGFLKIAAVIFNYFVKNMLIFVDLCSSYNHL